MKKAIIASLTLAAAATAFGQGQIKVDSLIGAAVVTITNPDGGIFGAGSAQVYRFDAAAAGGVGAAVGGIAPITANGRFKLADAVTIDGVAAGQTVGLIVRAWDGTDYASSVAGGVSGTSANWVSKPLGGVDPGGNLVITPKLDGFATFKLTKATGTPSTTSGTPTSGNPAGTPGTQGTTTAVPEPSTIALGVLGAAALVLRRRK